MALRIRTQAYVVSALPLLFLLALLTLGLVVQRLTVAGAELVQRSAVTTRYLDQSRDTLTLLSRAMGAYERDHGSVRIFDRIAQLRSALERQLRGLQASTAAEPQLSPIAAQIARLDRRGFDLVEQYAVALSRGEGARARALANAPSTATLSASLTAAYDRFSSVQRGIELSNLAALRNENRRWQTYLIGVCLAGILLTLLVSGRFGVSLARRISRLAHNARRAAEGTPVEPMGGEDEIADLDRVYQALVRRINNEHRISSTLQRALLPQALPAIGGMRIDAAYVPAAEDVEVGGDWYDVFALSPARIFLTIGDVAGHGVRAAAIMATARIAMRAAARIDLDPATMLAHVNRMICEDHPGSLATALAAVLDLSSGTLTMASAGHPHPFLVADNRADTIACPGLLLGVNERARYETCTIGVDEGTSLLFYTDGLVEAERDYGAGMERLKSALLAEYEADVPNVAEAIQARVRAGNALRDDAAVLFVRVDRLNRRGSAA